MKPFLVALFLVAALGGCRTLQKYSVDLHSVERPADTSQPKGEVRRFEVTDGTFADHVMIIDWMPDPEGMGIELRNKTARTLKIHWDNAAIVDTHGVSHRAIHTGVRLMTRDAPQAPSVIVRRGRLSDRIVPSGNVHYSSGGGWGTVPLNDGEGSMQVLLPVDIDGVVIEYIFSFTVEATVKSASGGNSFFTPR